MLMLPIFWPRNLFCLFHHSRRKWSR